MNSTRLDEQAMPRGEGSDRIEGREGRDRRVAVPARVHPCRAQSEDHHALQGGRAVGGWRHAVDPVEEKWARSFCPGEAEARDKDAEREGREGGPKQAEPPVRQGRGATPPATSGGGGGRR